MFGTAVQRWFPLGEVCSAKFGLIAFNEAIEIINKLGVYGNCFADNCVTMLGVEKLDCER